MKKTKLMVITAAIVLGFTSKAFAQLPANSIVVGNNVYDINYLTQNSANLAAVNAQIVNNLNSIYYVNSSGKAADVFSGATVDDSQIVSNVGSTLTYYAADGTQEKIVADANNQYTAPTPQNSGVYAIVNVNYTQITPGLYTFSFSVSQLSGVSGAAYFQAGDSSIVPLTDTAIYIGTLSASNMLTIYGSDGSTELAYGAINLQTNGNTSGTQNMTITLSSTSAGSTTSSTAMGNSSVNIVNTGFAGIDTNNQWIYYENTADGNKLYKKSVNGVQDQVVSDDSVNDINVVGDWIYYSNHSDNGKIYKVRTDGTQKQKVVDDMASDVTVIGDKIYYINNSDKARIYVYDSQGKQMLLSDSAKAIGIGQNYLYYINASDGNKLYSYDLINNIKTKVSDINTTFINVVSDYMVYYTGADGVLYEATGSQNTAPTPISLTTNVQQKSGSSVNVVSDKLTTICATSDGNSIYYKSYADGNKIYKLNIGTGNGYKVVDDSADYMNIVGNYLYYIKAGKVYFVPITDDGTIKGTPVTKATLTTKVLSVQALPTYTTNDITKFNFPDRVSAMMSDGTIQQLVVNWDKVNGKLQKGVYTYTGTILGYGTKVTLTVDLGSSSVSTNNVTVVNNIGNTDTVSVSGLNSGDIVNIYNNSTDTKPVKTATANSNGNAAFSGLSLNADGGNIYISVTNVGKAEGSKTVIPYSPEAPSGFSVNSTSGIISGLKVGRSYLVYLDNKNADGTIPAITNLITSNPIIADSSGTITLDLATPIGNSIKELRLVQQGSNGLDSLPSTVQEVGRPTVPSYVGIDLNLGRITGTTTAMQYSYDDVNWTNCSSGNTPISMTRSLQVYVKLTANGPYLESNVEELPLFAAPVITGITNGSSYSIGSDLTASWPANYSDSSGVTVTYVPTLLKVITDSSGNVTTVPITPVISGNSINLIISSNNSGSIKSATAAGDSYELTVVATKTVGSVSATATTTVNFVVSSAKPSPADISLIETPGAASTGSVTATTGVPSGIPTGTPIYYQATPTWTDLAGTYSTPILTMIGTPNITSGKLTYTTVPTPAAVSFVKGASITQNGLYNLTVTTIGKDNGATSTTTKTFAVDNIDKAVSPSITGIVEGGVYNSIISGIRMVDNPNCVTTATIMLNGYTTPYITPASGDNGKSYTGGALTVNGNYVLVLDTTNVINGATTEQKIDFVVNSSSTGITPTAPSGINFSFDGTNADRIEGATTTEEYSLNGGITWTPVTTINQQLTSAEVETLNNDSNNEILVRYKANGSIPASAADTISLNTQSMPSLSFSFGFDTTSSTTTSSDLTATLSNPSNTSDDLTKYEYSIDDGATWNSLSSNGDISNVANSITAANDVWVRQEATGTTKASTVEKIAITQAAPPSVTFSLSGTYANQLMGATPDMEFSLDGGITWSEVSANNEDMSSYISSGAITATNGIQVRSRASGTAMPGNIITIPVLQSTAPLAANVTASASNNNAIVSNVPAGATVTVYSDSAKTTVLGTGSNPATYIANASVTGLPSTVTAGSTIYVTIKEVGKLESATTAIVVGQ
jgi:hypothetical protein